MTNRCTEWKALADRLAVVVPHPDGNYVSSSLAIKEAVAILRECSAGPSSELERKVAAFSMLRDGWNSYGAKAFQRETITLAMEIARKLGDEWKAVPVADGSIEFYRNNEDEIVEVRTCFDESSTATHSEGEKT